MSEERTVAQSAGDNSGAKSGPTGAAVAADREVFGTAPPARSMTRYIRPTIIGIIAVYAIAVLLLNRAPTQINFLFFTATLPLIVALLVMLVLGAIIGAGGWMWRGRAKRKAAARTGRKK
jgi:uncharacterized integral membrane protein